MRARLICCTGAFAYGLCIALISPYALAGPPMVKGAIPVKGTGTDLLNGAVVHSKETTPAGEIQRSTEIIELNGDLIGKLLYHVTTVIDTKKGTLTNTGDQVFSGTIAGSKPVMIHDSKFRFDANLTTGADTGSVHLSDHIAGPRVSCDLTVNGTGKNTEGNPTFSYVGTCKYGPH